MQKGYNAKGIAPYGSLAWSRPAALRRNPQGSGLKRIVANGAQVLSHSPGRNANAVFSRGWAPPKGDLPALALLPEIVQHRWNLMVRLPRWLMPSRQPPQPVDCAAADSGNQASEAG